MNKYSFTNNGKTWERITKKQARAAYNNGLTVLFCPVNMRPFTPWHLEIDRFTGETPTAYTLGTVKQYDYSVMEG